MSQGKFSFLPGSLIGFCRPSSAGSSRLMAKRTCGLPTPAATSTLSQKSIRPVGASPLQTGLYVRFTVEDTTLAKAAGFARHSAKDGMLAHHCP